MVYGTRDILKTEQAVLTGVEEIEREGKGNFMLSVLGYDCASRVVFNGLNCVHPKRHVEVLIPRALERDLVCIEVHCRYD